MLSGGQRARVALARSVYMRANVTVLDDPLCALDTHLRAQVSILFSGEVLLLQAFVSLCHLASFLQCNAMIPCPIRLS